jgi:hypothetical protein
MKPQSPASRSATFCDIALRTGWPIRSALGRTYCAGVNRTNVSASRFTASRL